MFVEKSALTGVVLICALFGVTLASPHYNRPGWDQKFEKLGFANAFRRQMLQSAMGNPLLGNRQSPLQDSEPTNPEAAAGKSKIGSFKFHDGAVVGAGIYEITDDDQVEVDLKMKITPSHGQPGAGEQPGTAPGGPGGEKPEAPGGEKPEGPGTEKPEVPGGEKPEVPGSEKPEVPGGEKPEGPGGEKPEVPGGEKPEVPGGEKPEVPGGGGEKPTEKPGGEQTTPAPGGETTTAAPSGGGEGSEDEKKALNLHNKFRRVHDAPPLKLNAELSKAAAEYAKKLADSGVLAHASEKDRNGAGENLSYGCSTKKGQTPEEAVTNWYNEVCKPGYNDFGAKSGPGGTGHFTQVVWKDSAELGFGGATSDKDGMKCSYYVGRYKEAGNMMGDYDKNVLKGSFDSAKYCASIDKSQNALQ